jgi:hypothetical protein
LGVGRVRFVLALGGSGGTSGAPAVVWGVDFFLPLAADLGAVALVLGVSVILEAGSSLGTALAACAALDLVTRPVGTTSVSIGFVLGLSLVFLTAAFLALMVLSARGFKMAQ